MKYSIVTPVYNAEEYLKDCIESVIAQTYSEWELILIDDGSTDKSPEICDEYAKKDSRIKVVHKENEGPYKTRVLAKNYIEGDYTVGLDSDDTFVTDCLEQIEKARVESEADMIIFWRTDYYEHEDLYKKCDFYYEDYKMYGKEELLETVLRTTDHALWNKAVKSSIYKTAKYIEEKYKVSLSDDRLQVIPLVCNVDSAYAVNERLYNYRIRGKSGSHNYKMDHLIDNDWVNFTLRNFLKAEGHYSKEVERALEFSYIDAFLPRLYALRWKITAKDKKMIKTFPLLKTMTNSVNDLYKDKAHKVLLRYVRYGIWGPKNLIYKVILKYYIEPIKKREKK